MSRLKKATKRIPSTEEIANDSSLRWNSYKRGEPLWSDELDKMVCFLGYKDGQLQAGDAVLRPLSPLLNPLLVRRPAFVRKDDNERRQMLSEIIAGKVLRP